MKPPKEIDKSIPVGEAWFCEVRPALAGSGFHIESRTRVLGWGKDEDGMPLPRTAYGAVARRAFIPDERWPHLGFAVVELRDGPRSERRWWSPVWGAAAPTVNDRVLKRLLLNMRDFDPNQTKKEATT